MGVRSRINPKSFTVVIEKRVGEDLHKKLTE